jgi:hypothetical protein
VQELAKELSQEYAAAGGDSSSSSQGLSAQQQQSLVFELNRSGRYLAMKSQLKQMLVEVVRERYKAAGSTPTPAQVRAAQKRCNNLLLLVPARSGHYPAAAASACNLYFILCNGYQCMQQR